MLSMVSRLALARSIIKEEGLIHLLKTIYRYYILSFFYLPFCISKVRHSKFENLNRMVDFVYENHHGCLETAQIKSEIKSLVKFVKDSKPGNIMEIGTARGGTLFLLSKAIKNPFIVSLDLPGGNFGGGYPFWNASLYKSFVKNKNSIHLVRADSHNPETLQKIKDILGERKIDFLFIDGDHTYEGVKKDFQSYKSLVKKGGFIALHDIVSHKDPNCRVNNFWDEIKKKYKHEEFVEDWNQGWAGIGVVRL